MARRSRPKLVGGWFTVQEHALVKAVAASEGKTANDLVRETLLPEVCERAAAAAAQVKGGVQK